ncbi:MAG TPA: lamin tail domain-containing protein [Anaerolineales bacterium]|nr:lamin tail domain-containing protein [Anaerolineales bacterium]
MEKLDSFISGWKEIYNQQGTAAKAILLGFSLLALCCLCSILAGLFRSPNSSNGMPSPYVMPSAGIMATPTALFNFGQETFTPFPTFPTSTGLPITPQPPTETPTLTPTVPAATATLTPTVPSATATLMPTATSLPATNTGSVVILGVDKIMEYVDIKNVSNDTVNLGGWRLVSQYGRQSCALSGVLEPNAILRVWSGTREAGFSCRFPRPIWHDKKSDPAVLYDPQGQEVSRYP